jgi:hypothetical protein
MRSSISVLEVHQALAIARMIEAIVGAHHYQDNVDESVFKR